MNYKGKLFELSSKRPDLGRPEYAYVEFGPHHSKIFGSKCSFEGYTAAHFGSTKTESEQLATKDLLVLLNKNFSAKREVKGIKRNSSISPEINEILSELSDDPQFDIFAIYGEVLLHYYLTYYLYNTFPLLSDELLTEILSQSLFNDDTHFTVTKLLGLKIFGEHDITLEISKGLLTSLIGKTEFIHGDNLCDEFIFCHYIIPINLIVFQVLLNKPYIETPPTPPIPSFSTPTSYASTPIASASMDFMRPSHSYKNDLQEYAQKRAGLFPVYSPPTRTGPDHSPIFSVTCSYEGFISRGEGRTRKDAEQVAAMNLLILLQGGTVTNTPPIPASLPPPIRAPSPSIIKLTKLQAERVRELLQWPYPLKEEDITNVFNILTPAHKRLKFLGHSLLPKLLLTHLFDKYPDKSFEDSTTTRNLLNRLTAQQQQAEVAKRLQLEQFMISPATKNLLSDVLEALVALLYIDEGIDTSAVGTRILSWYKPVIERVLLNSKDDDWRATTETSSSFHHEPFNENERVVHLRLDKDAQYVTEVYSDGGYETIVSRGSAASSKVRSLEQQLSDLRLDDNDNDNDEDNSPEVTITLKNVKVNTFTINLKFLNQENMKLEIKPINK